MTWLATLQVWPARLSQARPTGSVDTGLASEDPHPVCSFPPRTSCPKRLKRFGVPQSGVS